jgi:hypothetical protein
MNEYRDRTDIKWKMRLMLPEHMEALQEWGREIERQELNRVREWDEQELEEFQQRITESYQDRRQLLFELRLQGEKEYISGIVTGFDQSDRRIALETEVGSFKIKVDNIVNISYE